MTSATPAKPMPKLSAAHHRAEHAGCPGRCSASVAKFAITEHLDDDARDQRRQVAEAQRAEAAGGDADERRDQADRRAHGADRVLREPEVVIEGVGHRPRHELGQLVEADHRQHQQREPAVDAEELGERTDRPRRRSRAPSTAALRPSPRRRRRAERLDRDQARADADRHQRGHRRRRTAASRNGSPRIRIAASLTSIATR